MSTLENVHFTINFILNSFIHITLLFSFLTILYYFIISPLTSSSLRDIIGNLIDSIYDKNLPQMTFSLSQLQKSIVENSLKQSLSNNPININNQPKSLNDLSINNLPKTLNDLSTNNNTLNNIQEDTIKYNLLYFIYNNQYILNNYIEQNSTVDNLVVINNQHIMFYSVFISISLAIISIILMIVFKLSAPQHINITEMLIENIGTFIFVGAIEYWFFTTYAFKYIPMPASLITNSTIDKIKTLLELPYVYSNSTDIPPLIIKPIPILFN